MDDIVIDLGELYREYISPLGPKVIIEGDPVYSKNWPSNASKIRALLLAGIRGYRPVETSQWKTLDAVYAGTKIVFSITYMVWNKAQRT